jgi:hypothetical protein
MMTLREASYLSTKEGKMIAALVIILLLVLLFGGLGLFVAKVFLVGLLLAVLVGLIMGFAGRRGTSHV